ncbi:MAG: winged helix DNA-binding protein [Oscillospiraceae bacterium]|nr:winged helix DNA-binding protein [Oscillospiraceae bacterium]
MRSDKKEIDIVWKKKLLFSGVFVQENRLHAIMDRYLKEMTCKQWLVMVVADAYDVPPDLSTLAKMLGCTRQNIKKLAVSLEKAGYVVLEPSKKDGRSLCVWITEKGKKIIENSKKMEEKVHRSLFRDFTEREIEEYFCLSGKMMNGLGYLEECFREMKENGEM